MNQSRPKVKRSRALGIALTPKAQKYLENRPYGPGEHGRGRKKDSDYRTRLQEKQKLRFQYDISEKQMGLAWERAVKKEGKAGEQLIIQLERRLDAFVLRAGFARTVYQARQMVTHGHIQVNGGKVDRPSYALRPDDVVEVREKSRNKELFKQVQAGAYSAEVIPRYIQVNLGALAARLDRLPNRSEIPVICEEQLVVEYYSR